MSGPIPARVDSAAKTVLLDLIDDAVKAGWTLGRICGVLELDRQRAWRWRHRRAADRLDDAAPGGHPIHGLLAWEEAEILALFEEWGPSTCRTASSPTAVPPPSGCGCRPRRWTGSWPATASPCRAFRGRHARRRNRGPTGSSGARTSCGAGDASHFSACAAAPIVYGIVDIVSRKWIASLLCAEATGTQVKVVFLAGLEAEGLLAGLEWRLDQPDDVDLDDVAELGTSLDHLGSWRADAAEAALGDLAAGARQTLSDARRLLAGYRRRSARAELESAADLLRAAGVTVDVAFPPGASHRPLRDARRDWLRRIVAHQLGGALTTSVTLAIAEEDLAP